MAGPGARDRKRRRHHGPKESAAVLVRLDGARDQRAHHEQHDQAGDERQHAQLDTAHEIGLGEREHREPARRLVHDIHRHFCKSQIDDLDLIAALLVEADGRAHQRGDAVNLLLGARLVDGLALLVLRINSVDQNGGGDTLDPAAFDHLCLRRARDFVIDDFLGLLVLVARRGRRIAATRRAWKFIADGNLTFRTAAGR